ncbi:MAG: CBS domain-containing protein [Planctomycetota bacterium]|nr:MAG: CBS domain-containing protein [Planctomycetota bacterium]
MQPADWLVSRWMSRDVVTVQPEDRLIDVFEHMRERRIRHVPVLADGQLVGIVSDRDVRHALPMRTGESGGVEREVFGEALFETPVDKVMTRHPITVGPETTIREAAEIVCREKIGALPVVSGGELVGIVSAEDLLWAFVENTADEEGAV